MNPDYFERNNPAPRKTVFVSSFYLLKNVAKPHTYTGTNKQIYTKYGNKSQ
jgi:hypothetical protein